MSVPPDRMAVRQVGDPNKIMGVKKPIFYAIIGFGVILAIYIWMRSRNSGSSTAAADPTDLPQGLTAADIGGTPADNSFATQTDQTALEGQIQQLQDAMNHLNATGGGNGAGVGTTDPAPTSDPSSTAIHFFGPGGSGVYTTSTTDTPTAAHFSETAPAVTRYVNGPAIAN